MEKKNLWWILPLVLIVLGVVICLLSRIEFKSLECSTFHPENCDQFCVSNEQCKYACGCGCIQINETCSYQRKLLFGKEIKSPDCIQSFCGCTNQVCSLK